VNRAMTMPAITAEKLVREFGAGTRAVDGIDLEVFPGEIYGFLGPNGAGKSTTVPAGSSKGPPRQRPSPRARAGGGVMAAETASGLAIARAPAGPGAAGIRAQAGAVARRSVTRTLRQRRLLILPVAFPLILFAINASSLASPSRLPGFPPVSYRAFALAVPFLLGSMLIAVTAGTDLAQDIQSGFLSRLALTPLRPGALLPTVIPPLFVLIAFAGGLSKLSGVHDFGYPLGYTAFIFVFASLQAATISGVFTGFAVARDFGTGFARRLLLTAPARSGIIAGYLAAAAVRSRTRTPSRNARRPRALVLAPRRGNRRDGNLGAPGALLSRTSRVTPALPRGYSAPLQAQANYAQVTAGNVPTGGRRKLA
jgi:energy-coupling factor transporter ATP-binding protein EcfA2